MKKLSIIALLALIGTLLPTVAHAYPPACGGTIVDDGTVVFGEVQATGHLGVCVRRPGGVIAFYDVPTCDTTTPFGYVFRFSSAGTYTGTTTIAPVVAAVNCGGVIIDPFPSAFHFGLWFTGYQGIDIAYGTPNRDHLHGNSYVAWPGAAADRLCGYGDDDVLVGDGGFGPPPAPPLACLNGGTNGAPGDECTNGDVINCEVLAGYNGPAAGDCGCGLVPPNIW